MTTLFTLELLLRPAIGFLTVSTFGTGSTGIPGIDYDHWNTIKSCLVLYKEPELVESPSRHPGSLWLAKPCPVPDAIEVFQGYPATGVFSLRNEPFADHVVHVSSEALLFVTYDFESAFDILGTLALRFGLSCCFLEGLTMDTELLSYTLDSISTVLLPIVRGGDIGNAQVHSYEVGDWCGCAIRHVYRHEQEPLAVLPEYQISLSLGIGKPLLLVLAHDNRDENPSFKSQERNSVYTLEAHDTLIIGHGCVGPELGTLVLVPLVGFHYLSNTSNRHLCRQPELRTKIPVVEFL